MPEPSPCVMVGVQLGFIADNMQLIVIGLIALCLLVICLVCVIFKQGDIE